MSEPLAYLITWTTYGTWQRGDRRCWTDKRRAAYGTPYDRPDPARVAINRQRMSEPPITLSPLACGTVENALRETCRIKEWRLHEISVWSNHVHVIVTAAGVPPKQARKILKEWATRALRKLYPAVELRNWWTEGGSNRYLYTEEALLAAIQYVRGHNQRQG